MAASPPSLSALEDKSQLQPYKVIRNQKSLSSGEKGGETDSIAIMMGKSTRASLIPPKAFSTLFKDPQGCQQLNKSQSLTRAFSSGPISCSLASSGPRGVLELGSQTALCTGLDLREGITGCSHPVWCC